MRSFFWVAVLCVALGGCSQDAGEACQSDGDCASGLKCDAKINKTERGTCFDPKAKVDSGTEQTDSGRTELPDDAAKDASSIDAGSSDGDAG